MLLTFGRLVGGRAAAVLCGGASVLAYSLVIVGGTVGDASLNEPAPVATAGGAWSVY